MQTTTAPLARVSIIIMVTLFMIFRSFIHPPKDTYGNILIISGPIPPHLAICVFDALGELSAIHEA
jgi:hypothetical protein